MQLRKSYSFGDSCLIEPLTVSPHPFSTSAGFLNDLINSFVIDDIISVGNQIPKVDNRTAVLNLTKRVRVTPPQQNTTLRPNTNTLTTHNNKPPTHKNPIVTFNNKPSTGRNPLAAFNNTPPSEKISIVTPNNK